MAYASARQKVYNWESLTRGMPSRRGFLAGLPATTLPITGCIGFLGDEHPPEERLIRVVEVTQVTEELNVEFRVNITHNVLSQAERPRFVLTMENTGRDELSLLYAPGNFDQAGVFGDRQSGPRGLVIASDERFEQEDLEVRSCQFTDIGGGPLPPAEARVRLAAGEIVTWYLSVVGDATRVDEPCPPAGEYRFTPALEFTRYLDTDDNHDEDDDRITDNWDGFTLELSD